MAYLIGQLRKNSKTSYMSDISPIVYDSQGKMIKGIFETTITSPNPFEGIDTMEQEQTSAFTDFALGSLEGFESGKVYYLRFKIHRIPQYFYSGGLPAYEDADRLSIKLILINVNEDGTQTNQEEVQEIDSFIVSKATVNTEEAYSYYSFVFTPTNTYNRIGFRINRVAYDILVKPRRWLADQVGISSIDDLDVTNTCTINGQEYNARTIGKRFSYQGNDGDVCILNNIIPEGTSPWLKFGYQCRPGSLIVVNKEPIRVGRSGIYEINNGTKIRNFMIANANGHNSANIDAFLLDYAYNTDDSEGEGGT